MDNRQKLIKAMAEDDLLFYARYIYKENHNRNFIITPHFIEIANFLMKVVSGEEELEDDEFEDDEDDAS